MVIYFQFLFVHIHSQIKIENKSISISINLLFNNFIIMYTIVKEKGVYSHVNLGSNVIIGKNLSTIIDANGSLLDELNKLRLNKIYIASDKFYSSSNFNGADQEKPIAKTRIFNSDYTVDELIARLNLLSDSKIPTDCMKQIENAIINGEEFEILLCDIQDDRFEFNAAHVEFRKFEGHPSNEIPCVEFINYTGEFSMVMMNSHEN
jgi:hypothetical protein